jgi:cobalt/nickel transport system ATP-binding protein
MTWAVECSGLRFAYPGGREALRGVDLRIRPGERVALLGPNGAGKTTLMLQLNGLLSGDGELRVAGVAASDPAVRARVGLVFQDPDDQLFMPSVEEDVAFGPLNLGLDRDAVARRVQTALESVGATGLAARAPFHLSMGERRRAALATALAMEPEVLVLDEPSASLDPRGRRELLEVLERLPHTLLIATHDLPFAAQLCDRAVILSDGRVAADGPARALLSDASLLAAHNLELPAGFDVDRLYRTRAAATAA